MLNDTSLTNMINHLLSTWWGKSLHNVPIIECLRSELPRSWKQEKQSLKLTWSVIKSMEEHCPLLAVPRRNLKSAEFGINRLIFEFRFCFILAVYLSANACITTGCQNECFNYYTLILFILLWCSTNPGNWVKANKSTASKWNRGCRSSYAKFSVF